MARFVLGVQPGSAFSHAPTLTSFLKRASVAARPLGIEIAGFDGKHSLDEAVSKAIRDSGL